jgi:hypothetical protein
MAAALCERRHFSEQEPALAVRCHNKRQKVDGRRPTAESEARWPPTLPGKTWSAATGKLFISQVSVYIGAAIRLFDGQLDASLVLQTPGLLHGVRVVEGVSLPVGLVIWTWTAPAGSEGSLTWSVLPST